MSFVEVLLILTLVCVAVWAIDKWLLLPKREELHAKTGRTLKQPWLVETAISFIPVLIVVFILRSFVAEPYRIPSGSMLPTLLEGDFILVNKYAYGLRLPFLRSRFVEVGEPKRGDVIVFYDKAGDQNVIKRVVGLPGDRIQNINGELLINGETVPVTDLGYDHDVESQYSSHYRKGLEKLNSHEHSIYQMPDTFKNTVFPYNDVVVPAGKYFVMGDNRGNSRDSRYEGYISQENILGRAVLTWLSMDWQNFVPRLQRIGKSIV